jgi:tetratricopeptide (TPR) repeat protein
MRRFLITLALLAAIVGCSGDPEGFDDLKAAGMRAFFDGDYTGARQHLLKALQENPSDKETLYFTGMAYKRDYYMDSALIYVKRADLYFPRDREINQVLYELAVAIGEWKYAQRAIMILVETGDPIQQHYATLVDLWSNMGSIINSFYYLKKMYRETGINQPAQFVQLAGLAAELDSLRFANDVLDSAVARFGANDEFLFTEAKIRFHEKNLLEAERILRDLVSAFPDDADFKINLANALANQRIRQKQEEALSLYREVKPTVPNPGQVDSLITRLESQLENE